MSVGRGFSVGTYCSPIAEQHLRHSEELLTVPPPL